MFVPSLSWSNDRFNIQMARKTRFPHLMEERAHVTAARAIAHARVDAYLQPLSVPACIKLNLDRVSGPRCLAYRAQAAAGTHAHAYTRARYARTLLCT
jgi:hypothetical protein